MSVMPSRRRPLRVGLDTLAALAGSRKLPRMAAAMPMPTSHRPSRTLCRLGLALVPAEPLGAVAACTRPAAGPSRAAGLRVLVRLVADAQLDRIDADLSASSSIAASRLSMPEASPGARMALATAMSSSCSGGRSAGCGAA